MLTALVPSSKVGTPFQTPDWRYQAVFSPEKFGLASCLSKTDNANSGYLARMIPNGVHPVSVYYQPVYMKQLNKLLSPRLKQALERVWNKHYYRTNSGKLIFNNIVTKESPFISWNMKKLEQVNDPYFRKLVKHCYHYEADSYIGEALKFYKNPDNNISIKWLNYSLYGGKTDKELAIQWHKPVRFIEAVRMLFFDYSAWPKDKLVQYSLIRQMVSNGTFDAADYHLFRRIFDLGDLGLRSVLGHHTFSVDESFRIKDYISSSGVDTLLDQRFTISSNRDIMNYNKGIADYANIGLKKLEMDQRAALMRLSTQRMEKEMGILQDNNVYAEDVALMDYMREMTKQHLTPSFPTFIDLKNDAVKVVVDK